MNLKFRLLLLLIAFKQVAAQNDQAAVLNQKITIAVQNETTRVLLKRIEKQTHLGFSYDSKTIDADKKQTVSFKNKTLPEIISILFDGKVKCKVKGNNIILYSDPAAHPAFKKSTHGMKKIVPNLKSPKTRADTTFLYYIDMIVPGFSGKDSVIRTDSIKVPSTHFLQIKDDTTILLIKKGTVPAPK
jgi:hypothetical protein